MLNKPTDIVVMFALIGVLFGVIGLAVTEITEQGITTGNTQIFADISGDINSTDGLLKTANSSSNVIDPSDDQNLGQTTEESFLFKGLQGLKDLGATYKSFENALTQGQRVLSIPQFITSAFLSVIIVALFVVIYTWWRGRG